MTQVVMPVVVTSSGKGAAKSRFIYFLICINNWIKICVMLKNNFCNLLT